MARYTRHSGCTPMHAVNISISQLSVIQSTIMARYTGHSSCMPMRAVKICQLKQSRLIIVPGQAAGSSRICQMHEVRTLAVKADRFPLAVSTDTVSRKLQGHWLLSRQRPQWLALQATVSAKQGPVEQMLRGGTRLRFAQLPDPEYRLLKAQAVRRVKAHHRSSGAVVVPAGQGSGLRSRTSQRGSSLQPALSRASAPAE